MGEQTTHNNGAEGNESTSQVDNTKNVASCTTLSAS
jgi:hypothetical protein